MERLNDIMGRTASRRQYPPRQRAAYEQEQPPETYTRPQPAYPQAGYSGQGSSTDHRAGNAPAAGMGARNPLREQRARLGQQPQQPAASNQRPLPTSQRQGYSDGTSRERRTPSGEQRPPLNPAARQGYARPRPLHDEAPYAPRTRSAGETSLNRAATPKPMNGYHHIDSYQRSVGDVAEDWNGDEDESIGMEYGDWEGGEQEVTVYRRQEREGGENRESRQRPKTDGDYVFMSQDYTPAPDAQPYVRESRDMLDTRAIRATHNLRDMYPMMEQQAAPAPQQPPVPRARTQEVPVRNPSNPRSPYISQRRTQPLDPRALSGLERDQELPDDDALVHPPRVVRASAANYAAAALPPPANVRGVCPICKGAGYLRVDVPFGHPNFGKPIPCECKEVERKEKRRQQLIELSDLSAFHNKGFKNFTLRGTHPSVQEAYQEAYQFAQNPNGWLVMIGPNGCGKTHLAAAIANWALSNGAVVLFTVVPDLLAHLRATFGPGATEAYEQRFSKMRESEVLVLDDLGAHQSSPWANEKLFQLLNYRYNSGFPTVITANESGLSSLDERIRSRISDTALVTRVIMHGAVDYRPHNPRR